MNIFDSIKKYANPWQLVEEVSFNEEELASISSAHVVSGDYGNSVCFLMVGGGQCYIPLDSVTTVGVGESVDPKKCIIRKLERDGEVINRIMY